MEQHNKSTIQYKIKLEGFTYHIRKGILKKGSTISKKVHPVTEVELLKRQLLEAGKLEDRDSYYECKRNIRTGLLMAYNLHLGTIEKELPDTAVFINGIEGEDEHIKDVIKNSGFYSADNLFRINIDKDAFKLKKVLHIQYDDQFFKGKGDGSFSGVETFVVDVMNSLNEITGFRRGDPEKHECDIVIESSKRQIEIVSFLDEKIPPKIRFANKEIRQQSIALEYCDFGVNVVSKGVIRKFNEKCYTDEYEKELAIYLIGSGIEARKKIDALEREVRSILIRGELKNDYKAVHIIAHDPFDSGKIYYISSARSAILSDDVCSSRPIISKEIPLEEMLDEEYYYVEKNCIFNLGFTSGALMSGADLKLFGIV